MRLLAGLTAGSGAAWITGVLVANPYLLAPSVPPVVIVAACYVVVAAGVLLVTRGTSRLPGRLLALWALAVIALGAVLAPAGMSLPLVGVAVLYGTVGFLLWVVPPLVVFSFVSSFRRPPDWASRVDAS